MKSKQAAPVSGQHERPELSFDGCGINGPDEYRTRIATFSNDAEKYGPLFASAPALLEALKGIKDLCKHGGAFVPDIERICQTGIAQAEGRVV